MNIHPLFPFYQAYVFQLLTGILGPARLLPFKEISGNFDPAHLSNIVKSKTLPFIEPCRLIGR